MTQTEAPVPTPTQSPSRFLLGVFAAGLVLTGLSLGLGFTETIRSEWMLVALCIGIGISATMSLVWITRAKRFFVAFVAGVIVYVATVLLESFVHIALLDVPLILLRDVTGVILAVSLAWRLWGRYVTPLQRFEEDLHSVTQRVLESDAFWRPLMTTIAKGERDEERGLAGLPDVLRSSRERWQAGEQAASWYIRVMAVVAALASLVLIWFGYIVVDDDAVGLGRSLRDVSVQQRHLAESLGRLESLDHNAAFAICCGDSVRRAIEESKVADVQTSWSDFEKDKTAPRLKDVYSRLTIAIMNEKTPGLKVATQSIGDFLRSLDAAPSEIRGSVVVLNGLLDEIKKKNGEPDARVASVLKRLAIGAVLATFFLAILRFLGGLHRIERAAANAAKDEEIQARKFLMCVRSAGTQDKLLGAVLKTYLSSRPANDANDSEAIDLGGDDLAKLLGKVIRESTKPAETS